jgi:hypothetical protein
MVRHGYRALIIVTLRPSEERIVVRLDRQVTCNHVPSKH